MLGQKKKTKLILRWGMAVAIALATGTAIYLIATYQKVSALDLYTEYYQSYETKNIVQTAMAANTTTQAHQFYQDKKYKEALPLFLEITKTETDNAGIQLKTGICQLELDRFERATQTFSSIDDPAFKTQANWYLAMTFLKQSDLANARTVLESFKPGDYQYSKAQEILTASK